MVKFWYKNAGAGSSPVAHPEGNGEAHGGLHLNGAAGLDALSEPPPTSANGSKPITAEGRIQHEHVNGQEGGAAADGEQEGLLKEGQEQDGEAGEADHQPGPPPAPVYEKVSVPRLISQLHLSLGCIPEELAHLHAFYVIRDKPGKLHLEDLDAALECGVLCERPSLRNLEQVCVDKACTCACILGKALRRILEVAGSCLGWYLSIASCNRGHPRVNADTQGLLRSKDVISQAVA